MEQTTFKNPNNTGKICDDTKSLEVRFRPLNSRWEYNADDYGVTNSDRNY